MPSQAELNLTQVKSKISDMEDKEKAEFRPGSGSCSSSDGDVSHSESGDYFPVYWEFFSLRILSFVCKNVTRHFYAIILLNMKPLTLILDIFSLFSICFTSVPYSRIYIYQANMISIWDLSRLFINKTRLCLYFWSYVECRAMGVCFIHLEWLPKIQKNCWIHCCFVFDYCNPSSSFSESSSLLGGLRYSWGTVELFFCFLH